MYCPHGYDECWQGCIYPGRCGRFCIGNAYTLSASALSHAETPCFPAFLQYPAFSCDVQRNSTRAVEGFLIGGLPRGRLGLSMCHYSPYR